MAFRAWLWLATFIHLCCVAQSEASAALAEYLGRPVDQGRDLNESFLLRLWDQQEEGPQSHLLCHCFPIMPSSLTRLNQTVRRIPFGKSVLSLDAQSPSFRGTPQTSQVKATSPQIYVSYAWGEDSTESGIRREEIVDRLCAAVEASGRSIGRDEVHMRGGIRSSGFANEISKATRIVAVLSEKSLHSNYCMVHELFCAFVRCNYDSQEFQEKVIPLVMDDAEPYLIDYLSILALAKFWQERGGSNRGESRLCFHSGKKVPYSSGLSWTG